MTTPLLLDTCAALWMVAGDIPARALEALDRTYKAGKTTFVSPITAWEVALLADKRRFGSSYSPERWFDRLLSCPGVALAACSPAILIQAWNLPGTLSLDPADRIVAATARELGLTVVTRDDKLLEYGRQGYISVLPC
jgi:PIN domain nuclease of toxin-antitoxin system